MKSALGSIPHSKEKQNKSNQKGNNETKLVSSDKGFFCCKPALKSPINVGVINSNPVSQLNNATKKTQQKNIFPEMKDVSSIQKLVKKHYISNVDLNCSAIKFMPIKGVVPIKNKITKPKGIYTGSLLNDSVLKIHKVSTNSQNKTIIKIKSPSNCKSKDTNSHSQEAASDLALKSRLVKDIKKSRNSANMNKITGKTKQYPKKLIPSTSSLFPEVAKIESKVISSKHKINCKFLDLSLAKNENIPNNFSQVNHSLATCNNKNKQKDISYKCNYEDLAFLSTYKPNQRIAIPNSKSNTQSTKILSPKSSKTNNSTFRKLFFNTQENEKSQLHHYKHAVSKQITQCITNKNSCNEDDTQIAEITGIMAADMINGSTHRNNHKKIVEDAFMYDHNFIEKPIKLQDIFHKSSYSNIHENQEKNAHELTNQSSILLSKENEAQGRNLQFTKENLNSLMSMKIEGPEDFHFIQVRMEIRYTKELAYKFEHLEEIKRENQNGVLMEQYDSDEDFIVN